MADNLDRIIDECIDRLNRGESLEACLTDYPGYVEQLKPLLQAMLTTREVYSFVPSPGAKSSARQRFGEALQELRPREERPSVFSWLRGGSKVWATAAAVVLIAIIGYFGLRPVLFPGVPVDQPGPGSVSPSPQPGQAPVVVAPQPSPEGNFVFLISDDVNAIGDFDRVDVSVSKVGLLQGDSVGWVEFEPQLREVDLTLVPGDKTLEIWRGDVPTGQYTEVFVQVDAVHGILKDTGEEVEIKLPSQKLHISKQFQVTADTLTSFTYDLTVVAAGNTQSGIKYILKPQVDQSGADHKPIEPEGKAKEEDGGNMKPGNKESPLNPPDLSGSEPSTKVTMCGRDTLAVLALYRLDSAKPVALIEGRC